ncbi:MAG: hypothetical protein M3220_05620 [Chloroflexota bacterium]|nr:hypothetical protein [Chloroflexota bacterium]
MTITNALSLYDIPAEPLRELGPGWHESRARSSGSRPQTAPGESGRDKDRCARQPTLLNKLYPNWSTAKRQEKPVLSHKTPSIQILFSTIKTRLLLIGLSLSTLFLGLLLIVRRRQRNA